MTTRSVTVRLLIWGCLACCSSLMGAPSDASRDWTVVILMDPPPKVRSSHPQAQRIQSEINQLVALQKRRLAAIIQAGSSPKMQIVVQYTAVSRKTQGWGKGEKRRLQRLEVLPAVEPGKVGSTPVSHLNKREEKRVSRLSDPLARLSDYWQWAISRFPAKHYALVVSDTYKAYPFSFGDAQRLSEMDKQFADLKASIGHELDVLAIPGSWVADSAFIDVIQPSVRYLIASESEALFDHPADWPDGDWLLRAQQFAARNRDALDPAAFVRLLGDAIEAKQAKQKQYRLGSVALLDLYPLPRYREALLDVMNDLYGLPRQLAVHAYTAAMNYGTLRGTVPVRLADPRGIWYMTWMKKAQYFYFPFPYNPQHDWLTGDSWSYYWEPLALQVDTVDFCRYVLRALQEHQPLKVFAAHVTALEESVAQLRLRVISNTPSDFFGVSIVLPVPSNDLASYPLPLIGPHPVFRDQLYHVGAHPDLGASLYWQKWLKVWENMRSEVRAVI